MFGTTPSPVVDHPAANPDQAAGAHRVRNSGDDARVGRDVPALGSALELGENNVLTIRIDPNLGQSRQHTWHLRADVRGDGRPWRAKHLKALFHALSPIMALHDRTGATAALPPLSSRREHRT